MEEHNKDEILITGHLNPDTDSVCAASSARLRIFNSRYTDKTEAGIAPRLGFILFFFFTCFARRPCLGVRR